MAAAVRLGLTGGIGSGKSTVSQFLATFGAAVIDADAIARDVTGVGGAAIASIRQGFGKELIRPDGGLDRDRMRSLAYQDPAAKKRLEAIVHPLVGRETSRQAERAIDAGIRLLVFDIPLLVESGRWRQQVHRVLVIDCLPDTQVARVTQRSGLDRVAIEAIIKAQASRNLRLAAADFVIFNEGLSLEELRSESRQIVHHFGL